jgi:arabinofuranan 3-O-arabinosyltransferase
MSPVRGALDKLTRQPVIAVFAFLYALSIGFLGFRYLHDLDGPLSPDGDRVAIGDFLAFETGAEILTKGRGAELYDLQLQRTVQDRLAGKAFPEWQPYVNPPLLAIAIMPLMWLGTIGAFRAYSAAMILAGLLGGAALVGVVPALARTPLGATSVVLLSLSFHPLARTMFGGQNSVLTWALLCGGAWALERGRASVAGVLLGLLSYKPQYVLLPALALAFVGAWRALVVTCAVALVHYTLGAFFAGPNWPLCMLAAMRQYRPMEWAESLDSHFSLLPFFDFAVGGVPGRIFAGAAIVAVIAALWQFAPRPRPGFGEFPLFWSLVIVAGMLVSPHLQYYDFAVLVLPVVVGIDHLVARCRMPSLALRVLVASAYVGYPWFYSSSELLGFQPLTIWTVAIYAWLCRVASNKAR